MHASLNRRKVALLLLAFVAATATLLAATGETEARTAAPSACASAVAGHPQADPTAGSPCWTDVTPYPFGGGGNPVSGDCEAAVNPPCLRVTSLAFRAWNRGLAATVPSTGTTPFGVWLWNGARWFPDPTFPGYSTCKGNTVLWAGKLDYWLVGIGVDQSGYWSSLCRFDGADFLWQPLKLPAATLARVPVDSVGQLKPGGITSGTCFSWDNCWFFGSFGTVVHWNGKQLSDQSPSLTSSPWLATQFRAAVSATDASGNLIGVAVGASGDNADRPLPAIPTTGIPAQLYSSAGDSWTPSPYAPPTAQLPTDPFRTDLVSVGLGANGRGWAAGDPAGWTDATSKADARAVENTAEPAPLVPITPLAADTGCTGPAGLTHTGYSSSTPPARYPDSYFWRSISVVPGTGDAIAGGQLRPGSSDPLEPPGASAFDAVEPVVVEATCAGGITVSRFLAHNPSPGGPLQPVEPGGAVVAVAANAPNDAWAATADHLYRLTDGQPPQAPDGDDKEIRPLQLQQDPPIVVFAPVPPPAPVPAPTVTSTTHTLAPAIAKIKSKLQVVTTQTLKGVKTQRFNLYVTFKVRRTVTMGVEALRRKSVVAMSGYHTFAPPKGLLVLHLARKAWPTAMRFLNDAPTIALKDPGAILSGQVTLTATARAIPIRGRFIASVRYDYAPSGTIDWTTIGSAVSGAYATTFDTTKLTTGYYDIRAVATDSAGVTGVAKVKKRYVRGVPG